MSPAGSRSFPAASLASVATIVDTVPSPWQRGPDLPSSPSRQHAALEVRARHALKFILLCDKYRVHVQLLVSLAACAVLVTCHSAAAKA